VSQEKKPSLPSRSLGTVADPKKAEPKALTAADEEFEVSIDDDPAPAAAAAPELGSASDPWGDGKEEVNSRGVALGTIAPEAHAVPPPPPPPEGQKNSFEMLMEGAGELFSLGDFTGSLETVEKALEIKPQDKSALDLLQKNQQTLMKMFESRLSSLQKRPRVRVDPSEVMWLSLDHRAGFVLAQIDGFVSYEEVLQLSGMNRFDTLRILAKLCEEGVIEGA
jgi:hypothetical protein